MKQELIREQSEFEIGDLLPIGLTLAVLGIGIAYALNVMSDVKGDFTDTTSAEYNATVKAIEGVSKIPAKMPLIGTVLVAVIIIGLLVRYLMVRY